MTKKRTITRCGELQLIGYTPSGGVRIEVPQEQIASDWLTDEEIAQVVRHPELMVTWHLSKDLWEEARTV